MRAESTLIFIISGYTQSSRVNTVVGSHLRQAQVSETIHACGGVGILVVHMIIVMCAST